MKNEDFQLKELSIQLIEDLLPSGMAIASPPPHFEVLYANTKLLKMLGLSGVEELNALTKNDSLLFTHPDDRPESERLEACNQGVYHQTIRMLDKTGRHFWVEKTVTRKTLQDGRSVIVAFYNDISGYKDAQQRLQDVNREMAAIYNNIPGGAFRCRFNSDWDVLTANDGFFEFIGYTREEFAAMGNKMSSVIYEEDKPPMIPILQKQLEHGNTIENTNRLVCKDQTVKWISIHATLFTDENGEQYFYCVFVDISAQKEAEKRLLQSDERYRVSIDGAGVNVWEYDFETESITQSEGSMKKHGFERVVENVPQMLVDTNYVAPEDQAAFLEVFEKMRRGETPVGGDFWVYDAQRRNRWCERIFYSVILDDSGRPVKAYGSSQDVTAFKIAEKRYQEEILYRNKLTGSVIAASCVILTRLIVEELRVGAGESIAAKHRNAVEYQERARAFAYDLTLTNEQRYDLSSKGLLERYGRGSESYETEFTAQLTKDHYVWVGCRVNILQRPDTGEIVAFFYNEDVTREKTLAGIVDSVAKTDYEFISRIDVNSGLYTAITRSDFEMPFLTQADYNSELEKYMAFSTDGAAAQKICRDLSIRNIVRELKTKPVFKYETDEKDVNGILRRKQLQYFYLNKEAGFILVTRRDIDDIVKKEQAKQEALEQAVNAKSEFLSRMSHDMRTPMNAIIGLSTLAMDTTHSPETADYLEKINMSGKYLLGLINDTLDMSRIESGKLVLHQEPYPGREFAQMLRNLLEPKAEEKGVAFTVDPAFDSAPTLMVDKLRFAQIFVNQANNAIKFTPKGGRVAITLEYFHDENGVQSFSIAVSDTGIGISEEFQGRMYESFEQEQRAQTGDELGTGLGLSIVKRLVDLMAGEITCVSAVGEGTTFHVTFSARFMKKQSAETRDQEAPADLSLLSGKRILLAEDHPLNVQVAVKLLQKQGCIVSVADNGEAAVRIFRDSPSDYYDAVLMDIRMPVMDGLAATRAIRSLSRRDAHTVPIIAMTANAYEEDAEKSRQAGMNAHLSKPIEPKVLFETLYRFLKEDHPVIK